MAAKKALALRVDEAEVEALKTMADATGKSMTRLLFDGVHSQAEVMRLRDTVEAMQRRQDELTDRLEKATGRKVQYAQYVRVPVTEAEHRRLRVMAADQKTSMGALVRGELEKSQYLPDIRGEQPALEVVSPA